VIALGFQVGAEIKVIGLNLKNVRKMTMPLPQATPVICASS
jgi:hypothetical protein